VTITVTYYSWAPSRVDHLFRCGAIFWPPQSAFNVLFQKVKFEVEG